MKKGLLTAALLAATAAAGAETFEFGYCAPDIKQTWGGVQGAASGAAIEIPADIAASWRGYKVVGMNIGFGDGGRLIPFITKDFNKYDSFLEIFKDSGMLFPLCDYSEGAPAPGSSKNTGEFKSPENNAWNTVTFTTPYVIDGESFKVGYYIPGMTSLQRPIATDGSDNAVTNNWYAFGPYGVLDMWNNQWENTTEYGNMCIRLIIEGDSAPSDMATVRDVTLPVVVKPGESFSISFDISNDAFNDITSIGGTVTIGSQDPTPFDYALAEPLAQLGRRTFTVNDLVCYNASNEVTVTVAVNTVNGETNRSVTPALSSTMACAEDGFARMVVFEEVTGTWCVNCPRGIVALRTMNEKYPDSFIGIAMHSGGNDPMISSDFEPFTSRYPEVPSGIMNRKTELNPAPSTLEEGYRAMRDIVYSRLEMKASFSGEDKSAVNVSTTTEFAVNHSDIDYAIGFIVTENSVGPYMQSNAFAGGSMGAMGGFEDMPQSVPLLHNDVARCAYGLYGLNESRMTEAEAGDKIPFDYNFTLRNVTNPANIELIALLLDRKSGEIINAARLRSEDITTTGVDTVTVTDDNAPVEYYNLQGIRVTEPAAGNLYIRRQGDRTSKIIF